MSQTQTPAGAAVDVESLIERHGLALKPAAVVHYSFADPYSYIAAHDPGGRITPLIEFLPLPLVGVRLLEAIEAIDENGPLLVANYRRAFPELYAGLASFAPEVEAMDSDALSWLFGAASLALGLEQGELARALQLADGVKVDTVVIERDDRYFFDGRRFLRSLMSYRIGEVPNDVLARSMFESLGDFAADAVRRLLKDWQADAIVCAGDLFAANHILRLRTRNAMIGLRVPTYFPPVSRS